MTTPSQPSAGRITPGFMNPGPITMPREQAIKAAEAILELHGNQTGG